MENTHLAEEKKTRGEKHALGASSLFKLTSMKPLAC